MILEYESARKLGIKKIYVADGYGGIACYTIDWATEYDHRFDDEFLHEIFYQGDLYDGYFSVKHLFSLNEVHDSLASAAIASDFKVRALIEEAVDALTEHHLEYEYQHDETLEDRLRELL
jgi:hypothetical protein